MNQSKSIHARSSVGCLKSLSEFKSLKPGLKIYSPGSTSEHDSEPNPTNSQPPPSLILLLSWTGAVDKHISRYTNSYKNLFPSTPILLVTTSPADFLFRSSKQKQSRLDPAVDYIQDMHSQEPGKGNKSMRILMHAFSEGGSNKACELAERYKSRTGNRLLISALFLDSTPGKPRYRRLCKGLACSYTSNPILRLMVIGIVSLPLGLKWIMYFTVFDYERNPISKTSKELLEHEYLDPTNQCYLYCLGDEIVASQDIKKHVEQCKAKFSSEQYRGKSVEDHKYEGSHVNLTQDTSYWDDIERTWKGQR
jgi:hypothetical protein